MYFNTDGMELVDSDIFEEGGWEIYINDQNDQYPYAVIAIPQYGGTSELMAEFEFKRDAIGWAKSNIN